MPGGDVGQSTAISCAARGGSSPAPRALQGRVALLARVPRGARAEPFGVAEVQNPSAGGDDAWHSCVPAAASSGHTASAARTAAYPRGCPAGGGELSAARARRPAAANADCDVCRVAPRGARSCCQASARRCSCNVGGLATWRRTSSEALLSWLWRICCRWKPRVLHARWHL